MDEARDLRDRGEARPDGVGQPDGGGGLTGRSPAPRDPAGHLRIRPATVGDAGLVVRLTLAAYDEYRDTLVPPSTVFDETEDDVRRHLAGAGDHGRGGGAALDPARVPGREPRSGALIAELEAPVGCVRWSVHERGASDTPRDDARAAASWLYVGRLSVVPAFRGRGIGTALLRACEDLALRRGIPEVRLGVRLTLDRNEALYERLGYRRTGDTFERAGFGSIAVWMSKRLG